MGNDDFPAASIFNTGTEKNIATRVEFFGGTPWVYFFSPAMLFPWARCAFLLRRRRGRGGGRRGRGGKIRPVDNAPEITLPRGLASENFRFFFTLEVAARWIGIIVLRDLLVPCDASDVIQCAHAHDASRKLSIHLFFAADATDRGFHPQRIYVFFLRLLSPTCAFSRSVFFN